MFNQSKYEIYWRKEQNGTPNEPVSPTNDIATSPRNDRSTLRTGALLATGAVVARKGFNLVRQEIAASGNERLQNDIDNAMKTIGYGAAIIAGGAIGTALVGADIVASAVSYSRNLQRENTLARINRSVAGKRVNIAKGSVYYG